MTGVFVGPPATSTCMLRRCACPARPPSHQRCVAIYSGANGQTAGSSFAQTARPSPRHLCGRRQRSRRRQCRHHHSERPLRIKPVPDFHHVNFPSSGKNRTTAFLHTNRPGNDNHSRGVGIVLRVGCGDVNGDRQPTIVHPSERAAGGTARSCVSRLDFIPLVSHASAAATGFVGGDPRGPTAVINATHPISPYLHRAQLQYVGCLSSTRPSAISPSSRRPPTTSVALCELTCLTNPCGGTLSNWPPLLFPTTLFRRGLSADWIFPSPLPLRLTSPRLVSRTPPPVREPPALDSHSFAATRNYQC